jgi:hypothetical protein
MATNHTTIPKFNKYDGTTCWLNAIFLWVNIGSDVSMFPNRFIQNGRYMTWFGGSKMHKGDSTL